MNVLTYEHLNVWMCIRMNRCLNELMSRWMLCLMDEWQEELPLECLNDLSIIQMTDRLICHLNDCPYLPILTLKNGWITANNAHPTEISVGCDKNSRIMSVFGSVFGRMGFYNFFGEFFGFFGIFLFFHSLAASVKRYFCLGCLGCSG